MGAPAYRDRDTFMRHHGPRNKSPANYGNVPEDELERRNTTTWDEDSLCRALVADNPDGMTQEDIGPYFGIAKQRVHQIERRALQKCARRGITAEMLQALARNPEADQPGDS